MTSAARTVTLEPEPAEHNDRIDRLLAARFAAETISRSSVTRWCEEQRVFVNDVPVKASYRVRAGDRVRVEIPAPEPLEAEPEDLPIDVLYQDDHVLVVHKRAGMVVHPAKGHTAGTLVNGLLFHLGSSVSKGESDEEEDPERPGIVHRIDRDTSGVLVVARTPVAREGLKAQFQAHTTEREYYALTEGTPPEAVTYDTWYGRHPKERMKFSSKVREGKRAVTHVKVLETFAKGAAALVACRLETGRTHQIRVHLSDAGFPLLADAMYGRRPGHRGVAEVARVLARQALHARLLGFVHPVTGARMRFEQDPPEDFQIAWKVLRTL